MRSKNCAHAHASPCWRVPPLRLHQAAGVRALPNQVDSHFGKSSLRRAGVWTCVHWDGSDACPHLPLNVELLVYRGGTSLAGPVSDRLGAPADGLWPL